MNHGVDGGHAQRVAAHQQRLEREHLLHLGVAEILAGKAEQRPHRVQFHQVRHHFQHGRHVSEVGVAQLQKAALEDGAGVLVEALVARRVFGGQVADLAAGRFGVAVVIEIRGVVEINAVKRQNGPQFDVATGGRAAADALAHPLGAPHMRREVVRPQVSLAHLQAEQLLDEVRHRDHGRPHVKDVLALRRVYPFLVGPPTGGVKALDNGGLEAQALKADAQAQAADA